MNLNDRIDAVMADVRAQAAQAPRLTAAEIREQIREAAIEARAELRETARTAAEDADTWAAARALQDAYGRRRAVRGSRIA
jgi:hypothetical protein